MWHMKDSPHTSGLSGQRAGEQREKGRQLAVISL